MQLEDLSYLKSPDEFHDIPLNGQMYKVVGEPPADVVLAGMGTGGAAGEIAAEMARLQSSGQAGADFAQLAQANPVLATRIAAMGMSQTERSVAFLQAVLEPESARRFAYFMRAAPQFVACDSVDPRRIPDDELPEGVTGPHRRTTDEEQAAHRRAHITLRQVMALYQRLIGVYSNRPTVPPSSSENGHGGSGTTSTDGAPAEVLTL